MIRYSTIQILTNAMATPLHVHCNNDIERTQDKCTSIVNIPVIV